VVRQMLNVAARCHLNGVVHRDLKPEVINFAVCWDCSLLMMGLNVLAIIVIVVCLWSFLGTRELMAINGFGFGKLHRISCSNLQLKILLSRQLILDYLTISSQVLVCDRCQCLNMLDHACLSCIQV
jgi:hypothetical protein